MHAKMEISLGFKDRAFLIASSESVKSLSVGNNSA